MTIAHKITLLFVVLSTIIITALSGFVWYFSNEFAFEDFYKRLEARVNINAQLNLVNDTDNPAYAKLRNRYLERLPQEQFHIIEVKNDIFAKAVGQLQLPYSFYKRIKSGQMARHRIDNHFYAGKLFSKGNKNYVVVVSANDPVGLRELNGLQQTLVIGFGLSILLALLAGRYFSNYTLNPLRSIIISVKRIKAENLHLRLEVKNAGDEMGQLAQTFNNMLSRLETAFETQNNFISNASHELRTPLAVISGEIELAERTLAQPEKQQAALEKIKYEANKLEHILTSLLGMAQSGFNGKNQPKEWLRIDELLFEIKANIEQMHPESKIEVDFSEMPDDADELQMHANKNLITLALSNIISNACKYSSNHTANVKIATENQEIHITVKDQGIGIPQSEIHQVFEPFYRASNTHGHKGYGVGLPLSQNIIGLHQGNINIQSEQDKGTTIYVVLPKQVQAIPKF